MKRPKTFRPVAALATAWKLSELWISSLATVGWETSNGKTRRVERRWDDRLGTLYAEEDIQSWVDTHPKEYAQRALPR